MVIGQPCRAVSRQKRTSWFAIGLRKGRTSRGISLAQNANADMERSASRRRCRGAVCMKSTCAEARKRQRRPHTLSGAAGLSGRGRRTCRPCLALPPSSGFWPKACGKNLANTFHLLPSSSSRIPSLNLLHHFSIFPPCSLYASAFFVCGIRIVGTQVDLLS